MKRWIMITVASLVLFLIVVTVALNTRDQVQPPQEPLNQINYLSQVNRLKTKLNKQNGITVLDHRKEGVQSHYVKNEVTVKFKRHPDEQEMERINQQIDGKLKKHNGLTCIFQSDSLSSTDLVHYFQQRNDVDYAEPNYILLPNVVPNDQYYRDYQWNLSMIRMEDGWDITGGSDEVIVAVVDSGVDVDHPDLAPKLVLGHNILRDNDDVNDDNGHGTHVAGIIAAATNNNIGVAGLSWNSRIMPVKGIGADGTGTAFDIANGIVWAVDHGASVINLSVGNYTPSQVLHDAVKYAFDRDAVLVAASGNDNTDQPGYPAAYPEVLAVGAVDYMRQRAEFSNYGEYIDVMAPGVDIPSTFIDNQYASLSGTSMATPHVAGLAALIRSVDPGLSNLEVMEVIRNTSIDLGAQGRDPYFGYGVIDGLSSLRMLTNQTDTQPPQTQNYRRTPLEFIRDLFIEWGWIQS